MKTLMKPRADLKAGAKPLVEALADEFNFSSEACISASLPLFKSYRAANSAKKLKVRVVTPTGFVPSYQLTGTVTCFNSSVERPSIGFSVEARSEMHLKPIARDPALFKTAS